MIDRDIYVCVKQKWNKKKWNIYAVVLNVYCFLSSISLRLLHLINYIPRRKSGIYWIQVRRAAAAAAAVEISLWMR